jgi:hypothetical protein
MPADEHACDSPVTHLRNDIPLPGMLEIVLRVNYAISVRE